MKLPCSAQSVSVFLERARESFTNGTPARTSGFEAIGREWQTLGVRPGDLVLLSLSNRMLLLEQFFGVLSAGGVPALVAPNIPSARLCEMTSVMGVRAVVGERLPHADLNALRWETIGDLDVALFPPRELQLTNPGEVVLLTSGTSGFSSGCVFDLEALLVNAERHADAIGQRSDDVVLVNLPLYFSYALVAQALATFVRGGRLVVSGPPFHAPTYEQTLARFDVTVSSLTPILARSLLQRDGVFRGGSPRVLTIGGDALAPEHVEQLLSSRPGGELYLTYGLTQAGPRVSTLAAHDEPPERYCSVGKPLAGTRVSLEAIDSSDCKQLWVSSDSVMKRTIGLVEGQSKSSHPLLGTVATGDIFEQDREGYLYFLGRLADFFIRDGEKISLAAVRRVAMQLPEIVKAKTRVIRLENGKEDFELALHVAGDPQGRAHDYVRMLHRWLRRAEMPGSVSVVSANEHGSGSYK